MSRLYSLRSDLEFSSQTHQGKTYLVVKDPVTNRYFRFTQAQAEILEDLRAPIELDTLVDQGSKRLSTALPTSTVQGFIASLEEKFLLDTPAIRDILANYKGRKPKERDFLYWKLASFNPEKIFGWLLPRTRWCFTRGFHVFAILAILTGCTLTFIHWGALTAGLLSLLNVRGLVLVWLVIFGVVTLHEFAHGLTCCHFGGKVQRLGFMLIYFQTAFFCDVSDSWMFPSKQQRLWVTFAGGYFQLVLWGIATAIWRITDVDTWINQIALVVVAFSGLQTLVNFNPLIKLDGYYMLSDYLEIPNLRDKSLRALSALVAGRPRIGKTDGEHRALLIYGLTSLAFSTFLLVVVYRALYTYATETFAFAGLIGFLMFSTYTLRQTASESVASLRAVASRAAVRKYWTGGILAAAILVSFFGHWELKIPADFKVLSKSEAMVRAETSGTITEVLVREGSRVKRGDLLARLHDFGKLKTLTEVSGELEKKRAELALLRAGARPEEIDRKRKLVDTKRVELANARRNQEQRKQLQQTLERKKTELQLDHQNLYRARELFAAGLGPRMDVDRTETAVQVREKEIAEIEASFGVLSETADREADLKARELAEAESELRLMLAGFRREQILQLEADVHRLENQVAILNQELRKTEIRTPIDGIVATPYVERKLNQYLDAGGELCRIVELDRVTVEMLVPEKEMAEVRAGNTVWMKVRSFPAQNLEGRVDFISPVAQTLTGQQMIVVRSELANPDLMLKPDMTGVAKIYSGKRRIIDLMTRRIIRWFRAEFWHLLP